MADVEEHHGRAAVLAVAGDSAYVRSMTSDTAPTVGYCLGGAVAWTSTGPWGPLACVLGPDAAAAALFDRLYLEGRLADVGYCHLPLDVRPQHVPLNPLDRWEARTLVGPPPTTARDGDVEAIDDPEAINALLAEALPHSSTHAGEAQVRAWYGVRAPDGCLLACGADRSGNGVGVLAGIGVRPDAWGQGLGAAVTAVMTQRLHAEFGVVTLGVTIGNARATTLYDRLGFTEVLPRAGYRIEQTA
jgi:GNAT superfamily N-acetyltransferase